MHNHHASKSIPFVIGDGEIARMAIVMINTNFVVGDYLLGFISSRHSAMIKKQDGDSIRKKVGDSIKTKIIIIKK